MARKKRSAAVRNEETVPVEVIPEESEAQAEQSGDLQGLSDLANADSESVRELVEEGQFYEAEVISGVENAPPADEGPVRIHKRRVDDVPPEYTDDRQQDEPKE